MSFAIALYQPDIPGNTGTILRLGACIGCVIHVIEPAGFDLSDRNLRRSGMDYLEIVSLIRHNDWADFIRYAGQKRRRIILFTTKGQKNYFDVDYQEDDILLFGRESAGVPDTVHQRADLTVKIPMSRAARSLNLAVSVAMGTSEALRQQYLRDL